MADHLVTEHDQLVEDVKAAAARLSETIRAAEQAGVSEALIFPALVGVFKDAGMVPDWLSMDSLDGLAGLLGGR